MAEKRRATLKTMENATDQELDVLVKALKKIQGFNFLINAFVKVHNNKIERTKGEIRDRDKVMRGLKNRIPRY